MMDNKHTVNILLKFHYISFSVYKKPTDIAVITEKLSSLIPRSVTVKPMLSTALTKA